MQAQVETNRMDIAYSLFDEILEFCLYSSVCKTLNLSFSEIMRLDYASYRRIRTKIEERDKKMDKEQRAALQKQEKLTEDLRNARKQST